MALELEMVRHVRRLQKAQAQRIELLTFFSVIQGMHLKSWRRSGNRMLSAGPSSDTLLQLGFFTVFLDRMRGQA